MNADIITIGDEILIGHIVNTNASFLGEQLQNIGVSVRRIVSVGDKKKAIIQELKSSMDSSELVIITGGLGPTHDDITKKTLADFFSKKLVFHDETYQRYKALFDRRNLPMSKLNDSQAFVLEGCKILKNDKGIAPGMLIEQFRVKKRFLVAILPGVPFEMKPMFLNYLVPLIKPRVSQAIKHVVLVTEGVGESSLAEMIGDPDQFLNEKTSLAFLPSLGRVKLRLSATANTEEEVLDEISRLKKIIVSKVGKFIYAKKDIPLEESIAILLKKRRLSIATAESCTGGLLASSLTDINGASTYFLKGAITYSREAKIDIGVKEKSIDLYGEVSEEVAIEMAKNIRKNSKADIGLSTTGIAGPGGGTKKKPVGLLWTAVVDKHNNVLSRSCLLEKDRLKNKKMFTLSALSLLRKHLLKHKIF